MPPVRLKQMVTCSGHLKRTDRSKVKGNHSGAGLVCSSEYVMALQKGKKTDHVKDIRMGPLMAMNDVRRKEQMTVRRMVQ